MNSSVHKKNEKYATIFTSGLLCASFLMDNFVLSCVYVYLPVYVYAYICSKRVALGASITLSGVIGRYQLPDTGVGSLIQVLFKRCTQMT